MRIANSWGVGRISLTPKEAVDLLVSIASIEHMDLPMMFGNSRSIRSKLIATFSRRDQAKISQLASRIRIGPRSSLNVIESYRPEPSNVIARIQEAFLFMRSVGIRYEDSSGGLTNRTVEPHYMVFNYPVWYVMCWDHLREDIRTFRSDRIVKVRPPGDVFRLRPWDLFSPAMHGNRVVQP